MIEKLKFEIKWAFIFIGVMLAWMVLERALGFHDERIEQHPIFTMFFFIPAIAVYVFATRDKKRNFYQGQMSYKQGFMFGLVMTLIITVFSPLTQWVISAVITPDYFDNVITWVVDHGTMTREAAEAQFNYPAYAIQSTIWALISGVVTAAIVSIFFRSRKSVAVA